MLVQDMLTGRLHEVPDYRMAAAPPRRWPDPQMYGLGEVHDGYGNSLGLFFLPKLIKSAVGTVSNLVRGALPGAAPPPSPPPIPMPMPAMAAPAPPCPPCPPYGVPPGAALAPPGFPAPFPRYRRRRRR
jgi:hypothetical protein